MGCFWLLFHFIAVLAVLPFIRLNSHYSSALMCIGTNRKHSYTTLELLSLNSTSRFPAETYELCAALGIVRRPRYIHRGSRRTYEKSYTCHESNSSITSFWSTTRRRAKRSMAMGGGNNKDHIRSLKYLSIKTLSASSETLASSPINMALLNARSLSNKSFILNDFFSSKNLDFLFLTETCLTRGDVIPLGELTPANCTFKNSPRSVGRGGDLATVYRNQYHCKLLLVDGFSSSEVQLMKINLTCPVFCAHLQTA